MKKLFYFVVLLFSQAIMSKTIVFIDNSVSNDTYIASNKERQISQAYKMGLVELKKNCASLDNRQLIGKEPLSIFNQAKEIESIKGLKIIFGLIHSSEALLAAEAFKTSNILALSSGAATDHLNLKNPLFFSLANPISNISIHVESYILKMMVKKPIALIPGNSSYSIELAKSLKEILAQRNIVLEIELIDTTKNHQDHILKKISSKGYDFIYAPGFIQQTLPIFESISKTDFKGIIYGSANLARSKTDLKLFSSSLNLKNLTIRFPATWIGDETSNSKLLEKEFFKINKEEIMGTAVYTYDAVLIAGSYICSSKGELTREGFLSFVKKEILSGKVPTARKYLKIENGHFISKINTVKFNNTTQNLEVE
jgi:hypothetical protein